MGDAFGWVEWRESSCGRAREARYLRYLREEVEVPYSRGVEKIDDHSVRYIVMGLARIPITSTVCLGTQPFFGCEGLVPQYNTHSSPSALTRQYYW